MRKDCRSEAEKKILFMTDMKDNQRDPRLFGLFRSISNAGVSIDIIGIG
jgi:type IV secretory pathway protease TraF